MRAGLANKNKKAAEWHQSFALSLQLRSRVPADGFMWVTPFESWVECSGVFQVQFQKDKKSGNQNQNPLLTCLFIQ